MKEFKGKSRILGLDKECRRGSTHGLTATASADPDCVTSGAHRPLAGSPLLKGSHTMQRSDAVKRRAVRSNPHALNRRSWPLAPGSIRQQLKDRERQDQLSELLGRYSAHGLPPLPELLALGRPRLDDVNLAILDLEPHWQHIVDTGEGMTKKQQEHQEAVWELLVTEVSYITQIRVIIDVFQNCLINVQQEGFLNEIETERLFSNIDKIFECNLLFWQEYLLPVLQRGRDTHHPLDPMLAKEGFVEHFPIQFQVYFKYFIEHKSCLEYAKSRMESSDLFKTFITWAEAQKQCNRLKLADILVKPMQRLLKYSLLLQAILKHTQSPTECAGLQEMIQCVDKLCWAANTSLQRREDYEKLEAVRKTIDLYDAIEAPNDECAKIIQEYNGNFNLLAPMPGFREGQPRSLLAHSSLRMKEAQAAKVDVDVLLFTDLILICKSNKKADRFKIIRPPMRLDQMVVSELRDRGSVLLIYMNEYHVPISAFTFHGDVTAVRAWLDRFRDAQKDFKLKKIQESAELERLRCDAISSQEEVHYTPLINVPSDLDLASMAGFPRSESMESADRFIPNLLLSPHGEDGLGKPPAEIGRSGSTGDIYSGQLLNTPASLTSSTSASNIATTQGSASSLGSASTTTNMSGTPLTNTGLVSTRPPPGPVSLDRSTSNGGAGPSSPSSPQAALTLQHKPVQSCRSVPNITVGQESGDRTLSQQSNSTATTIISSPATPHRTVINVGPSKDANSGDSNNIPQQPHQQSRSNFSASSLSDPLPPHPTPTTDNGLSSSQISLTSAAEHGSVLDEEELSRLKLASRRTSRAEKRYHTADSIQEMRACQEKDASIHKRLSWRTDVQVVDNNKNLGSPGKAVSSDSVRSCPSSSGVSSTGSLHLNLESDISEECETSGYGGGVSSPSPAHRRHVFTIGDNQDTADSNYDDDNNNERGSFYQVGDEDCGLSGQDKSKSDLVTMFANSVHVSEMEDGIASVAVATDGFNRKLTHADILKMKKLKHQVLYDANIESSEV